MSDERVQANTLGVNGAWPKNMAFLDFYAPDSKGSGLTQFNPRSTEILL